MTDQTRSKSQPARVFVLSAILMAVAAWACFPSGASADHHEEGEAKQGMEAMSLHDLMEGLNKDSRQLSLALVKGETDKALEVVTKMQVAATFAKAATPKNAEGLTGDEQVKFITGYRMSMVDVCRKLLDAEAAILAGDNDTAKAAVKDLYQLRMKGHSAYKS